MPLPVCPADMQSRFEIGMTLEDLDWLDRPPTPEEGEIRMIETNHQDERAAEDETVDCHNCGFPVQLNAPHVYVSVWLIDVPGIGDFVTPRFCSRPCFIEWARSSGRPPSEEVEQMPDDQDDENHDHGVDDEVGE